MTLYHKSVSMKVTHLCTVVVQLTAVTLAADSLVAPRVQLKHGGQYEGRLISYNNTDVSIFLGKLT